MGSDCDISDGLGTQRTFSALTSNSRRRGSAPSFHKHGSSMASNSSGGSPDRQRMAQQRLRIIAGHLQRPVDGDSTILAADCKAQGSKPDASSEGRTVPRRR